MADQFSLSIESLKNLTGDDLLREIAKQIIFVNSRLGDIFQLMIEMDAKLKKET